MAQTKIKATAQLFLDTSSAESDARQFVSDLKKQLSSIETAADKMTVFKDMVDYIGKVDRALATLKAKNGDAFNHMFDGMDAGLRKQFEELFNISDANLGKLDALREKLDTLTPKSGMSEIRKFAKDLNALFTAVGADAPFDIETQFRGRANADHIRLLTDELNNFATVWDGVNAQIKSGFGVSGGTGGGFSGPSKEVQAEIDKLKKQADQYKAVIDKFNQVAQMKAKYDKFEGVELDFEATEQAVDGLIQKYNTLGDVLNEASGDSIEYANALADRAKLAMQMIELDNQLTVESPAKKRLQQFISEESLDEYPLEDFEYEFNEQIASWSGKIQDVHTQIENLGKVSLQPVASSFKTITQEANKTAKSVQNVMYHLGNLLNGKGSPRDTFGDMIENLTTMSEGTRYEKYGFGALGGGLFGVSDPSTIDQDVGKSTFIQSVDLSKYNMYMADTEERATALIDFLSKLQKFSIKSAEPNYTGFDEHLNGADIDSLYDQFKVVFDQSELTKDQFQAFVGEMVTMLKQAGLAFDAQTGQLDFTKISKEIAGSENISTRFMKMLGYEGVNVGTTSFDGLGQGSVLFDFEKVDIVGYFNSAKEAVEDYQKIIGQTDGSKWVGSTEQLQQYASNIDTIISRLEEYKKSGAIKDTSALDETLRKLAQIKTNIGDILSGKDISGNSPFETITTGSGTPIDTSAQLDQTKAKLESFLALSKEIQDTPFAQFADARDNVQIGQYTERLEQAKNELEELGRQGLLTAEQIEQVFTAFKGASGHLDASTKYYDNYGGYDYSYYDEYREERERAESAEGENTKMQRYLDTMQKLSEIDRQIGLTYDYQVDELDGLIEQRRTLLDEAERTNSLDAETLQLQKAITGEFEARSKFIHDGYDAAERDLDRELTSLSGENVGELSVADIDGYIARLDMAYAKLQEAYNNGLMGNADTFADTIEGPYQKAISSLQDAKNMKLGIATDQEVMKAIKDLKDLEQDPYEIKDEEAINDIYQKRLAIIEKIGAARLQGYDAEEYEGIQTVNSWFEQRLAAFAQDRDDGIYDQLDETHYFDRDSLSSTQELEALLATRLELMGRISDQSSEAYADQLKENQAIQERIALMKELEPLYASGKISRDDLESLLSERGSLEERASLLGAMQGDVSRDHADDSTWDEALEEAQMYLDTYEKILVTTASGKKLVLGPDMSMEDYKAFLKMDAEKAKSIEFVRKATQETTADTQAQTAALEEQAEAAKKVVEAQEQLAASKPETVPQQPVDTTAPVDETPVVDPAKLNAAADAAHGVKVELEGAADAQIALNAAQGGNDGEAADLGAQADAAAELAANTGKAADAQQQLNAAQAAEEAAPAQDARARLQDVEAQYAALLSQYRDTKSELASIEQELGGNVSKKFGLSRDIPVPDAEQLREAYESLSDGSKIPSSIQTAKGLESSSYLAQALFQMARYPEKYGAQLLQSDQLSKYFSDSRLQSNSIIPLGDGKNIVFGVGGGNKGHYKISDNVVPKVIDDSGKVISSGSEYFRTFAEVARDVEKNLGIPASELQSLPVIKQAHDDYTKQLKNDGYIGGLLQLLGNQTPEYIDALGPLASQRSDLQKKKSEIVAQLRQLDAEKQVLEQEIQAQQSAPQEEVHPPVVEATPTKIEQTTQAVQDLDQAVESLESKPSIDISDGIDTSKVEIASEEVEQLEQTVQSFDTPSGQLSFFDDIVDDANRAESEIQDVADAMHSVSTLPGQMSLFDAHATQDGATGTELFETDSGQIAFLEGVSDAAERVEGDIRDVTDAARILEELPGQVSLFDSEAPKEEAAALEVVKQEALETANAQQVLAQSSDAASDAMKTSTSVMDGTTTTAGASTKKTKGLTDAEKFAKSLSSQKDAFGKYSDGLKDVGYVTDELRGKLDALGESLGQVNTQDGLDTWVKDFKALQKEIAVAQKIDVNKKTRGADALKGSLRAEIGTLDFKLTDTDLSAEQSEIAKYYKDVIDQLEAYKINVKNGQDAEISGIEQTIAALQQKIKTYKEANNIVDARGGNKKAYGASAVTNAQANYNTLQGRAKAYIDDGSIVVSDAMTKYEASLNALIALQKQFKSGQELSPEQAAQFTQLKNECNAYGKELKKILDTSDQLANSGQNPFKLEDDVPLDSYSDRATALKEYVQETYGASAAIGKLNGDATELTFTIKNGDGTITNMTASLNAARTAIVSTAGDTQKATSKFGSFFDAIREKTKELWVYAASRFGVDEIIQQVRQGIEYIREIDTALTELKKVTNETDATYDAFLQTMSQTAGKVGSTVSELTTMAAEWARLGYSIEEAGQLAESTAILLNVSEFKDANAASEALISTMQAFSYTADESQHVVDILNEVGNNYAVSSDGIATALQDSASALMEAGNNLEQSVALVAAANKVVQDPNSVGSALRTISLRLRGTSVEILEEMGEETDGAVESVSKLQEKIQALSGVDILTESGDYKDTYTILKEIGQVWEDMDDVDQAALLELMAGKNRANTLSAILSNMEDLEGAYKSALNAEGSAMRENEAYLDSIQGRIDLFTNALQTMWMNLISSDTVKSIVDVGTFLIKQLDTGYGKIIAIIGALMVYKKMHDGTKFSDMFKGAVEILTQVVSGTKEVTVATISEALASKKVAAERTQELLVKAGLAATTGKLTKEEIKNTAATLSAAFSAKELTASQYLAAMSSMGLKTALQGLWTVLKANPVLLVAAAVAAVALAFDHFHTTAQEASDAAKEAFNEIQSIVESTESAIQSLESELASLQNRIDELSGKKLSFAEEEELERLKGQREELEHSLSIQKQLLELQRESSNRRAITAMKAYTKAASEGADETQKTAKTWGTIAGVVGGALLTLAGLALIPISGGSSSVLSSMGVGSIITAVGAGAAAGGVAGNKAGEAIGSGIAANDGTYDSWYKTYTDALDAAREDEQKALEAYQKDSSNIDKLDKWQEAQQRTTDIETEMYEHLSQMQQYYNGLEYGISEDIDNELDTWYNFLDKFAIDNKASGAEATALDRIFGENASKDIQDIKTQILDSISAGEDFDFETAINGCDELKSTLNYIGLEIKDVEGYFTQLAERIAAGPEDFDVTKYIPDLNAVSSKMSSYQSALESLESGTFTLSDFIELIEQFPELADGVDVSSKSFDGLSTNLRRAIRNAPEDLIDRLEELRAQLKEAGKSTKDIDQLIEAIEQMPSDSVKNLSDEFITLTDSINDAKVAQNELKEAMSENPNEGFETRGNAMEQMKTLMEEGKIGSESELWSIAEAFGFTYDSAATINENADALYAFIRAREAWYKTDENGNYTIEGTESFLNDVERVVNGENEIGKALRKMGVEWSYADGALDFDFNNANWEEIVTLLGQSEELAGLTSEEFYDLLMQVGQFFDINWQNADDLISFMDQINKGSESASENFDSAKNAVQSFLESQGYSADLLEISVDSDEFKQLPEDIQKVLEEYYELKAKFEEDPLGITWQLDRNSGKQLAEESIESLSQLTTLLQDNESGTVFIDYTHLKEAAKEAGYTEEAIDKIIEKIKEYNNVCGIETSTEDPLGLIGLQSNAQKTEQYLTALQVKFETIQNSDNTVSFKVEAESLVAALQAMNWTPEAIQSYLTDLQNNGYSFTIDGGVVDLNSEEAKQKLNDLTITKQGLSKEESTPYTVTGTGEQTLNTIQAMWDNIVEDKTTNYTINETTNRTTNQRNRKWNPSTQQWEDTFVNGTAHLSGAAHAQGSVGAPKTETALVGELGPEMLVRNGRWTTVGENGAEFRQIKKGDIIFNHKQTEQLLKNGYVTGRGKAYASGTAYASTDSSYSTYRFDDTDPSSSNLDNAAGNLSDAANDIAESTDEFREVFDWIEVRLEEINDDLSLQSAKLENQVGHKDQNKIVDKIIDINQKLYKNLIAGANKYYAYAEKLLAKVPEEYRKAAQDGTIAIEEFVGETDEKTLEAIQEYREWVQKGDDLTVQAEEALTEISNLAKQAIDNIESDFGNKTSLNDSKISQLEAYNALLETDKGFESEKVYQAIIAATNANIKKLKEQRNAMLSELDAQVSAGNIEKYSQNWYDAVNAISDVDTQIIELTADTEDYQDTINELHWDHFDALMSQYEAVADEAENLIDILGSKDLVDKDTAEWTDEGVTSLGLYAQKMEVAEMQAKQYEKEIAYLNKNWRKLGYTEKEYIEKLDELKDGQYDAIKAYNDTKDAIVDLNKERVDAIKNAIEKETEAYEELISKKKEELDAEKDLHDFQKGVADQQKEIVDIERKLAALSADNSASARAKRAQLEAELAKAQADLQETYYDRSISDQQEALDKELENFQNTKDKEMEGWDEYLENTNQVVSDSLSTIQSNTDIVYQTLLSMGEEYSLSIAESITSPWQDGEDAVQSFSEKFGLSMSSTVEELQKVASRYKEIMAEIEDYGTRVVDQANKNVQAYQSANKEVTTNANNSSNNKPSAGSSNAATSSSGLVSNLPGYLQRGSSGDDVRKLQEALNALGFDCGNVDGIFGDKTRAAVIAFQSSSKYNGAISADGIVGPDTKKKFKVAGYAGGTTYLRKSGIINVDELGEELRIGAKNGRLTYMEKGSGIIPADLTENLMGWGQLDPTNMLEQNRPQIGVSPSVVNNTTEIHIDASVGELLHVEHLDGNNPAEITKIVDKAWDKRMKELNGYIRRYTNR